jgi:hypothetical protein
MLLARRELGTIIGGSVGRRKPVMNSGKPWLNKARERGRSRISQWIPLLGMTSGLNFKGVWEEFLSADQRWQTSKVS